jgi:molecular chaperone DnaK (HSP70)
MAKEIILGIDLGTTNSVVSYLQADGKVKSFPIPKAPTRRLQPSLLKLTAKKSSAMPLSGRL